MNITTVVSPTIIKTTVRNTNRTNGVTNNLTPQTQDAVNLNTNQRAGSLEETESRLGGTILFTGLCSAVIGVILNQLIEYLKEKPREQSITSKTSPQTVLLAKSISQRSGDISLF